MQRQHSFVLDQNAFNKAQAKRPNQKNTVIDLIANRLLERLQLFRLNPSIILDMGAEKGLTTRQLKKIYKKAFVLGLEYSDHLIKQSQSGLPWQRPKMVRAGSVDLPLASHSVDLIFSNLSLLSATDLQRVLKECHRVLKPEGLFLFTTVGPDTLKELRASFATIDNKPHVHHFIDMHDIGDLLVTAGFSDPVMDVELLTLHYASVKQLCVELRELGAVNCAEARSRGLLTPSLFQQVCQQYESFKTEHHKLPATIELIYGHAFGRQLASKEFSVPLHSIKIKK